jgi:hypothetical protein
MMLRINVGTRIVDTRYWMLDTRSGEAVFRRSYFVARMSNPAKPHGFQDLKGDFVCITMEENA